MKSEKPTPVKDFLFLQYGRSLFEAISSKAIHLRDLNNFEDTAVRFYEQTVIRPYERPYSETWDEGLKKEIEKAQNSTEPLINTLKPQL